MNTPRYWQKLTAPLAILAAVLGLSLATGLSWARAQGDAPHPAHIHSGSCDNLGEIVAPLDDVALRTAGETFGAAAAIPVEESDTEINVPLGTILQAAHAVNIHLSADAIQTYIACGDIGGRVVDGKLTIGLRETDGSGYSGVAVLEDDGDETEVKVYLTAQNAPTGAGDAAAAAPPADTPAAPADTPPPADAPAAETPAPAADTAAPAAQEVPVDIRDFLFTPDPIEVPAGGTVTWTNQGNAPHTATAVEQGVLQSGRIDPGNSFSQQFPTAGEFSYFCEFHPNMTGTIVVK